MTPVQKTIAVLLACAAVLGALFSLAHLWNSSIENARTEGVAAGRTAALKEVADRDNAKLLEATRRIKELEEAASAAASRASDELAEAQKKHDKEINDAKAKNARLSAALAAGNKRLRDAKGVPGTGCPGSAGSASPAPAAPSAGVNGGGGCELSSDTSAALWTLAERCDRISARLKLAQATIRTYVKACSANP